MVCAQRVTAQECHWDVLAWALWYGNEEAATLAVGTRWALFVFLPHLAFQPVFFFLSQGDIHVNTVSKGR